MDQKGVFKLVALLALLTVTGFSSLKTFATTEQNVSDENTNGLVSNGGDIFGTVQNISQPVNILSHNAREDGGYLHVVGEVENGLGRPTQNISGVAAGNWVFLSLEHFNLEIMKFHLPEN